MSYLVKNGDKLFIRKEIGPWAGLVVPEVKEEQLMHRWAGPKLSLEDWKQVLAFFEWSQAEHKSEALVQLFVDLESGRWQVIVPPQEGVGMTVKILENHPNYKATYERLGPGNWELMGTVHHHCSSSAFQSGTDHHDELSKEGLHITVGGLGSGQYSLHSRCSFRKVLTDSELGEWFEVPEAYADLPANIQSLILKHVLTVPSSGRVPGTHFPELWADNYIQRQSAIMTRYGHTWTPSNQVETNRRGYSRAWSERELVKDIGDFCGSRGMSTEQFLEWVKELHAVDGIEELVDICVSNYSDLVDVIAAATDAATTTETKVLGFGADGWDDDKAWEQSWK